MTPTTETTGWPRLVLPARSEMSARQAAIYDSSVDLFGGPYGPRLPLVLTPELHEAWAETAERLSATGLPARLRELAILVTARFWDADFVWFAHEGPALNAGLGQGTVERIRAGLPLAGAADDEHAVAEFVGELLRRHRVGDRAHARVAALLGARRLVELTVLVGHYTSVAFVLAAHAAPLPDGVDRPLPAPMSEPTAEERPVNEHPVKEHREYYAQAKDVRLYVREDGAPAAPPLLLSNSLGTDISMWEPQMEAFTRRYRVIRYDMRGHGRSESSAGGYDIELLARDALAVLDAAGVRSALYCGLSLGGMVGQWLAINEPRRLERAVLASAGIFIPPAAVAPRLEAIRARGLPGLVDEIVPRWFTPAFIDAHPAEVEALKDVFRATSEDGYYGCSAALGTLDHRERIGTVTVPVLVIGGEHDPAVRPEHARELAEKAPGAELVMLDAAHLSNLERPERFTEAALTFLAGP